MRVGERRLTWPDWIGYGVLFAALVAVLLLVEVR